MILHVVGNEVTAGVVGTVMEVDNWVTTGVVGNSVTTAVVGTGPGVASVTTGVVGAVAAAVVSEIGN